jgi:ABC-type branched-subunit amino acid transport system substrate-binding protein
MADIAPILLGVLHDHAGGAVSDQMERCVRFAFDELADTGRLDRDVEIVHEAGDGLPGGSAHAVERAYAALVERGVLAVIGPAISDNGLIVRDLAEAARVPTLNYTGSEDTRGHYGFHYQIGSLEDEPYVLAHHLVARGIGSVTLFHDASPIGRRYASYFDEACATLGIRQVSRTVVPPLVEDLAGQVSGVASSGADAVVYLGLGLAAHALGVALAHAANRLPVVANSALMFGYANPPWTAEWQGWVYCDTVSEGNAQFERLRARLDLGDAVGPGAPANYDMGRLLAEGVTRAPLLSRDGLVAGLERVKMLPAASGRDGTLMGFGRFERSALKGPYLVLREWRDGVSVEVPV